MDRSRDTLAFDLRARGDWVRLRTLVLLRWVAVAGQAAAVLVADTVLGFDLPMAEVALVISSAVLVNIVATLVHPAEKRLSEHGTLASLVFDLLQVTALLMLTGGLNNPFAVLIIAPVTISATALRLGSTAIIGLVALGAIPVMAAIHLPLVHSDGTVLEVPALYSLGLAAALAVGVVFLALYIRRVIVEGHRMSEALTATQLALAREQELAAIGSMAAAAAHELGTPLATIKLTAAELARELGETPDLAEDAALIRKEAERCGEIMASLSRSRREDTQLKRLPVQAVVEEAAAPHANRGREIVVRVEGMEEGTRGHGQPMIPRSPELIHGLRNIIQNAVDFARRTVWIDIEREGEGLRIAIGDDGPGFASEILPRLAEPYITSRRRESRGGSDPYEGMGLGLFIARTLLERTGAQLTFANATDHDARREDPGLPRALAQPPGAVIEIFWRRLSDLEGPGDRDPSGDGAAPRSGIPQSSVKTLAGAPLTSSS